MIRLIFSKKKKTYQERVKELSPDKIPIHVGIIMDGNGRWAKKRGLPRIMGHREGVKVVKKILKYSANIGVKYLTLYTFSTENWKRPKEEVSFLMKLFVDVLNQEFEELYENNVKLRYIGFIDELPEKVKNTLLNAVDKTKNNTGINLILALNYGARREIIEGIKNLCNDIVAGKIDKDNLNQELFSSYLLTKDIPDPDLIIRTAGEYRISNFLLWQIAYSEIYITKKLWPDFDEEEMAKAIYDYSKRVRKFGGLS